MYSVVVFYHIWCIFYEVVVFFDGACHRPAASAATAIAAAPAPQEARQSILGKGILYTNIYDKTKLKEVKLNWTLLTFIRL